MILAFWGCDDAGDDGGSDLTMGGEMPLGGDMPMGGEMPQGGDMGERRHGGYVGSWRAGEKGSCP